MWQKEWASGVLGLEGSSKYGSLQSECIYREDHFNTSWALAQHTSVLGDNDSIPARLKPIEDPEAPAKVSDSSKQIFIQKIQLLASSIGFF